MKTTFDLTLPLYIKLGLYNNIVTNMAIIKFFITIFKVQLICF